MPLSISNSNARIPDAPWGKLWLLTISIVVGLLAGWEGFWRIRGFVPSLNDDAQLWAFTRKQVEREGKDAVVLLGTSRMQLGLNVAVFTQTTGIRPVQLAMNAEVPIVPLRHLANDPSFCGTIICEMAEDWMFPETIGGKAAEWIRVYEQQTWSASVEQWLESLSQSTLVFRLPSLAPSQVWNSLLTGTGPVLSYITMLPNRSMLADYTKLDIGEHRRRREVMARESYARWPPWPPAEFRARVRQLDALIAPLYARGGLVIFVRFPTSGAIWEMENQRYPRAQYWDVLVAETRATTIHFKDYPALAHFECPDGSHLDYRDALPFTQALADLVIDLLRKHAAQAGR